MNLKKAIGAAATLALAWWGVSASASTITHTEVADFAGGVSDGIVQPMAEAWLGGAVGLMPSLGASVINDEFDYTDTAAASANYLFLTPNLGEHGELAVNPSQFLFSGDVPAVPEAVAPPTGILRLHCSRGQDFYNTGVGGQRSPMMAVNKTILTGDFVVETKFTIQGDRNINNRRFDGLFIGRAASGDESVATDVPLDNDSVYIAVGVSRDGVNRAASRARIYPAIDGWPYNFGSENFPGNTWFMRIVKRGAYFYTYLKDEESAPWVFHMWYKNPLLAEAPGVVVGVLGVSWGGTDPAALQYQDDDFEYLKVNRIGSLSGSYTNVFDAGTPADWQTVSLNTASIQGTKYQLRAGNTLAGGTLTDGGSFAGPDGTSATWFTDDAAQVVPNAAGKRYLEYKLAMDAGSAPSANDTIIPVNLPAFLRSISASWFPAGLSARILSDTADYGADAGGVQTQTGGGDLSLARTQVLRDDFSAADLDPAYTFDPGYTILDPGVVGDYSLTERPGYLRLKVGYPQDFYGDTIKLGGVKAIREIPQGTNLDNFEIETEVNMEVQQARFAALLMWMGPNDYFGIGIARRFPDFYDLSVIEDSVINNITGDPLVYNYGSNSMQLRVTKQGTVMTLSFRDPNSASPSWRVLLTRDIKGQATGGADFTPIGVGFLGKSYQLADQATVDYDFNYLLVSNLATTGQKDIPVTLPAESHPDSLLAFGDALTASTVKGQVRNAEGTFIGPDGTSNTYFTLNEPKLPATLDGITDTAVRLFFSQAPGAGVPYLHATGIQYASSANRIARDSNKADFTAGSVKIGIDTDTLPGAMMPKLAYGASVTENFTATPSNWAFSNNPPGTSTFSYTDNPGFARVNCTHPTDTWGGGTALEKPRCILYNTTPVTGDFELETYVEFPYGRDTDRNQGLTVIQAMTGTPPDGVLDMTNIIAFGPYRQDAIRMLRGDNNGFADFGPGGYTDNAYFLRLRKIGNRFTGYVSTDGTNWTEATSYTMAHTMTSMYIGYFAKTWGGATGSQAIDYDYFKYSPITMTGTFESRIMDLGVSGLTLFANTLGGNSANATLQFRAADTTGAIVTAPWLGPDGTSATTYPATASTMLTGVSGRYVQYKAILPPNTTINDVGIFASSTAVAPLTAMDALNALQIAGGLKTAGAADQARLDVEAGASAGKIGIEDAVSIMREVNGL